MSNLSWRGLTIAVGYGLLAVALLVGGRLNYPHLHTILDTGMLVLSGVLAWLFWEVGRRLDRPFPHGIAISFAITSLMELVHVLVTVEWQGVLAPIAGAAGELRPGTWPPSAYILPIGIGCALLTRSVRRVFLAGGLVAASILLLLAFDELSRYSPPSWLGITRPSLVLVPFLWALVGWACWRWRERDRALPALTWMAAVLVVANVAMLYSRAPHDTQAMIAHLGRVSGYLMVLLTMLQLASSDMLDRIRAEAALAEANAELESRVRERTAQLEGSNRSLQAEIAVRREAEQKVDAQLVRLNLLQQITAAVADKLDAISIFQVVIRRLEDSSLIDFGCIYEYDATARTLTVVTRSMKQGPREPADELTFPVDANGLANCVLGQLIYEPDTMDATAPLTRRFCRDGFRSLVAAPLLVEGTVQGVLFAARRKPLGFNSGDCEFLRQLSEHVGLAMHQAQLYTALHGAYEDLRRTQQSVLQQERLRALGQMASGIAHDINNSMAPVALYTDALIRRETQLSSGGREQLEIIRRAIGDVRQTLDRLQEFSRQHEASPLMPVAVGPLLEQVVNLTRARWHDIPQESGTVIAMVIDCAPDLPAVLTVESELREALTNLVLNAVDAMPAGGSLTVRARCVETTEQGVARAKQLRIEISDTGCGMDEETRRRCIEPFFTTKGERGTGLGLAMVYGIAQRHGSQMEIKSVVGSGTTIALLFATTSATARDVVAEISGPSGLHILVIDDDPLIRGALAMTLEADDHTVTSADGGKEGIAMFRNAQSSGETFDAVITDLGMPYIDGRQVAAAIKALSPDTPVILLTGWGQRLPGQEGALSHVDHILGKPATAQELRSALAAVVRR